MPVVAKLADYTGALDPAQVSGSSKEALRNVYEAVMLIFNCSATHIPLLTLPLSHSSRLIHLRLPRTRRSSCRGGSSEDQACGTDYTEDFGYPGEGGRCQGRLEGV